MCQCWLTDCNKCSTLVWDVNGGRSLVWSGEGGICCEPKTALKIKLNK